MVDKEDARSERAFNVMVEALPYYEVVIGSQFVRSAFAAMGRQNFRSSEPKDRGKCAVEDRFGSVE